MIVRTSYGFVYNLCKGFDDEWHKKFDNRKIPGKRTLNRNFKRDLNAWRKKFEAWMDGKFESVEAAFTW